MPVFTSSMEFSTRGGSEIIDITGQMQERLSHSGMREGVVTVFVPGSTGGVITLECELGLVRDWESPSSAWPPGRKPIITTVPGATAMATATCGPRSWGRP